MTWFICTAFNILIWCVVLGYPYSALLSNGGFWGMVAVTCLLISAGVDLSRNDSNKVGAVFGWFVILFIVFGWGMMIFSTPTRNDALSMIGMKRYLADFASADIPSWKFLVAGILNVIITGILQSLREENYESVAMKINRILESSPDEDDWY